MVFKNVETLFQEIILHTAGRYPQFAPDKDALHLCSVPAAELKGFSSCQCACLRLVACVPCVRSGKMTRQGTRLQLLIGVFNSYALRLV